MILLSLLLSCDPQAPSPAESQAPVLRAEVLTLPALAPHQLSQFLWAAPGDLRWSERSASERESLCRWAAGEEATSAPDREALLQGGQLELALLEVSQEQVRLGGVELLALYEGRFLQEDLSGSLLSPLYDYLLERVSAWRVLGERCGLAEEPGTRLLLSLSPDLRGETLVPVLYTLQQSGIEELLVLAQGPLSLEPKELESLEQSRELLLTSEGLAAWLDPQGQLVRVEPQEAGQLPDPADACLRVGLRGDARWAQLAPLISEAEARGEPVQLRPVLFGATQVLRALEDREESAALELSWDQPFGALPLRLHTEPGSAEGSCGPEPSLESKQALLQTLEPRGGVQSDPEREALQRQLRARGHKLQTDRP